VSSPLYKGSNEVSNAIHHRLHEKIVCSRYYRDPERQNILNLIADSDVVLRNCSLLGAKQQVTRDAHAYGYKPISKWTFDSNGWKRQFCGRNGVIIAMVHLFE